MNNDLQAKNIIISAVEVTQWGIKLKDEKGLIYNISQYKKDTQDETVAYQYISKLPKNGMGMTQCVKFATVKNNQGGESRYVRIVSEKEAIPEDKNDAPFYSNKEVKKEDDSKWEDINRGKCRFGFLIEAYKMGKTLNPELVSEVNKWADVSMTGQLLSKPSVVVEDMEVINRDEEEGIRLEDIPF